MPIGPLGRSVPIPKLSDDTAGKSPKEICRGLELQVAALIIKWAQPTTNQSEGEDVCAEGNGQQQAEGALSQVLDLGILSRRNQSLLRTYKKTGVAFVRDCRELDQRALNQSVKAYIDKFKSMQKSPEVSKYLFRISAILESSAVANALAPVLLPADVGGSVGEQAEGEHGSSSSASVNTLPNFRARLFSAIGAAKKELKGESAKATQLDALQGFVSDFVSKLKLTASRPGAVSREWIDNSKEAYQGLDSALRKQLGGNSVCKETVLDGLVHALKGLASGNYERATDIKDIFSAIKELGGDNQKLLYQYFRHDLFTRRCGHRDTGSIAADPLNGMGAVETPRFYASDPINLFEALFCKGSDDVLVAPVFREIRGALLDVTPDDRTRAFNFTLAQEKSCRLPASENRHAIAVNNMERHNPHYALTPKYWVSKFMAAKSQPDDIHSANYVDTSENGSLRQQFYESAMCLSALHFQAEGDKGKKNRRSTLNLINGWSWRKLEKKGYLEKGESSDAPQSESHLDDHHSERGDLVLGSDMGDPALEQLPRTSGTGSMASPELLTALPPVADTEGSNEIGKRPVASAETVMSPFKRLESFFNSAGADSQSLELTVEQLMALSSGPAQLQSMLHKLLDPDSTSRSPKSLAAGKPNEASSSQAKSPSAAPSLKTNVRSEPFKLDENSRTALSIALKVAFKDCLNQGDQSQQNVEYQINQLIHTLEALCGQHGVQLTTQTSADGQTKLIFSRSGALSIKPVG